MFLKKLSINNFRNYDAIDLSFEDRLVSFIGKNGMGKTNLLDAIHYLSFTKSFINTSDQLNIRHGESFFRVSGEFELQNKKQVVFCSYQPKIGKTFKVGGKPLEKMSDHVGALPVVIISPNDTDLVREWSELRRKFFDSLICQLDRKYLETLIGYNHFLKQRNALLKTRSGRPVDTDLLDQYDGELAKFGEAIFETRKNFISRFEPVFGAQYKNLSQSEQVGINYKSDLFDHDLQSGLLRNRDRDILLQRTTLGIHRDDFEFQLKGYSIKKSGSQGQQKSFVIALRLSQFEILQTERSFKPILLLDDIFDKLDDVRISRLTQLISEDFFGQIFITDARPERTADMVKQLSEKVTIFDIEDGAASIRSI